MFVIEIEYKVELEQVEPLIEEHFAFLDKYYQKGLFVVSGRKEPRTGGIIIVKNASRSEVEELIKEDSFYRENVADYKITEFLPARVGQGFESLAT
ncbi:YciI family protein [Hahella ganghwensis]|uniref:YciI family protein n=1 Tax=Hahella ganghwensis TaxID=286420 RepID=UPI00035C2E27|nr:YciI family protein [Hahella ganghwensis]